MALMRLLKSPAPLVFIVLATLILLIAAALRLLFLNDGVIASPGMANYPPGVHYDEAVYLLVTRSVAFDGARPFPILEAYQGREVLYFYLNAPLLTLFHDSTVTLRWFGVFSNLITIAASIALGRMMFRGSRGVIVGLAMGVGMTIAFPQVWLARQAFRAVTLPLMQALTLIVLWRGLRGTQRYGWLIAAGICAGLTLYTYNSSRLFPVWLALGGLVLLIADRQHLRQRIVQGAVFFGVFALVAAPIIVYAFQRPDVFFNRLNEVTQPEQSITLLQSVMLHARMFFIEGDPYVRYNIPGRPYLTFPEGVFMLVGAAIAAGRLLRAGSPLEKAAYALALLSPLMVIPSVISVGGLPPSHMRSLGMIPLLFVLVGLGYEQAVSTLSRLITRQQMFGMTRYLRVGFVGIAAWVLIGGFLVGDAYFKWAAQPVVYYENDADLVRASQWGRQACPADCILYIAAKDRPHPSVMIANLPNVTYLGTDSLFFPPPGRTGIAIFPNSAPSPEEWRSTLMNGAPTYLSTPNAAPEPFEWYTLTSDAVPRDLSTPNAAARNLFVSSLGVQTAYTAYSGERVALSTVWRIDAPPTTDDLTPIVQLEDEQGVVIARDMPYITQTDQWRIGETYLQRIFLDIPVGTPQGEYALDVAWVARVSDQYQPYLNGAVWERVGTLTVQSARQQFAPDALMPELRIDQDTGTGMRLLGHDRLPVLARPGETLQLNTYWQAAPLQTARQRASGYQVSLNDILVYDADWGQALRDGDLLTERALIQIPRDQANGMFTLELQIDDESITLGVLTIEGTARRYQPPPVAQRVDALYGEAITLYGYTLHIDETGVTLDVVWRAEQVMTVDYTIFVHVVDAQGAILDQIDIMPLQNTYPTRRWQPGEFVLEQYLFPIALAARADALRVGIYQPETGQRLMILHENSPLDNGFYEIPLVDG